MERPALTKEQLIRILAADRPIRSTLNARMGRGGGPHQDFSRKITDFWRQVNKDLIEILAQRLLDPAWDGQLLGRELIRRRVLTMAQELGTFRIPDAPPPIRDAIVEPTVDFMLSMRSVPFDGTHDELWGRVEAILTLATSYGLPPEAFLFSIPGIKSILGGIKS